MTINDAVSIAADLLPKARLWIRRTATNLDDEIQQTIAACLLDLKRVGVAKITAEDPLIAQTAKLYVKARFGSNDDSEKYYAAYEHLRDSLSLCSEYTEVSTGEQE